MIRDKVSTIHIQDGDTMLAQSGITVLGKSEVLNYVSYFDSARQGLPLGWFVV
jgi:hypothetical protein